MRCILVTGGAGFIGSHLCEKLLKEGNRVICLDNLFTGSQCNIERLFENPNFEFVKHDIVNKFDCKADQIYNLACPASPPHYQYDPIKTTKTSVIGILNMLELAEQNNATLLQASTSEVYGNPLEHPQKESYWGNVNPIGIRSCYDEGKRCAETLVTDYRRRRGVDTRIVRIFNTYGPNMDKNDGRVVSNFIIQALKGENITIYGDGTQSRSFCYIDDLVDGLIRAMNGDYVHPINLGNPSERTISELAQLILKLTNSTSKIEYCLLPEDDPVKRKPDISVAKEYLSWEPKTDIIEGLKHTIEYFQRGLL